MGKTVAEALDEINCGTARNRGEEDGIKAVSRRTEIAYIYPAGGGKAEEADEGAQQAEVRGCASTVNAAVVQRKCVFLSGEICPTGRPALVGSAWAGNSTCDWAEVSRSHSRSGSRPASGTVGNEPRHSRGWSHPAEGRNLHGYATIAVSRTYVDAVWRSKVLVVACRTERILFA